MPPSVTIKSVWVWLLIAVCCWALLGCSRASTAVLATPCPQPTPTMEQMEMPQDLPESPDLRGIPAKRIAIVAIGVDARIVELGMKYDSGGALVWETPAFAVGHYIGTSNPGEAGNIVLAGHISSPHAGAVFKGLPKIAPGDAVTLYSDESQFLYRVTDIRVVEPSEVEVMLPTEESVLTLITCVPDGVYSHRLIVTAKPI